MYMSNLRIILDNSKKKVVFLDLYHCSDNSDSKLGAIACVCIHITDLPKMKILGKKHKRKKRALACPIVQLKSDTTLQKTFIKIAEKTDIVQRNL